MSNTFVHRASIVCALFVVGVVLMVLVTRVAASPSGVLDACVNPGNGMMRLVSDSSECHNNETFVEWNIQGPQGPQGPQPRISTSSMAARAPPTLLRTSLAMMAPTWQAPPFPEAVLQLPTPVKAEPPP